MSTLSVVPAGDTNLAERVAAEVRAELARRQITQQQFAPVIGLSQASLSDRMRGKTPFTIEDLGRIAEALRIHPAVLVGGYDPSPGRGVTAPSLPITTTVRGFGQGRYGVGQRSGAPRRDAA